MSKTVTLEVSDTSSIELDFFFQTGTIRTVPTGDRLNIVMTLTCNLSRIEQRPHNRGEAGRNLEVFKSRDPYVLEERVTKRIIEILEASQKETDPRRVVPNGVALRKFVHACLWMYIEETHYVTQELSDSALSSVE